MLGRVYDTVLFPRRLPRGLLRAAGAGPKVVPVSVETLARAQTEIVDVVRSAAAIARAEGLSALFFLLLVTLTFLF